MTKWVYSFGNKKAEGSLRLLDLLGGKGANLAEMCHLGLAVPPGFTITTKLCRYYDEHDRCYPSGLHDEVKHALNGIEVLTGRVLGDIHNPLLLSVRSGSRVSMPGMMDTVLNLGLNDETVKALAKQANKRFAYDSYRRFIQMYAHVVLNVDHYIFEELLDDAKTARNYDIDTQMTATDWQALIEQYKTAIIEEIGKPFPQDPHQQLWGAIGGVLASWKNARAVKYRAIYSIPEDWGTAVNVQAMVFGNMGDDCATGVAFTRNPSTGVDELYGEFLVNAQGEDVVAGIRTPQNITEAARLVAKINKPSLEKLMPYAFAELTAIARKLEAHYRDVQDLEFTIEQGKLWILQTRNAKRTAAAALKIAIEMAEQGIISEQEAVLRMDPASLDQLLHPTIDPQAKRKILATGLPASPGAAVGEIVFSSEDAENALAKGRKVILVRLETSPEDIHGINAAHGILTTRGGMTSHAAVVARGMGKPCVCGAGSIKVDYQQNKMIAGGVELNKGDIITIDGTHGHILLGKVDVLQPQFGGDFGRILQWADNARRMKVRANADTVSEARVARAFGAEGIGLCRTEQMFFSGEAFTVMREMIVAADNEKRRAALARLLVLQRAEFVELFEVMAGFPVTIRLLDQPLHEFLPKTAAAIAEVAMSTGADVQQVAEQVHTLRECNAMLGLRGCRLAITYPDIAQMQARAIFEAAILAEKNTKKTVVPEIIVPLVALKEEFDFVKSQIDNVAKTVMAEQKCQFSYQVGTMIELPRAAFVAGEIAQSAQFFSFGTNDLTQTMFGISRDDTAPFLNIYLQKEVLIHDPFVTLDVDGVGACIALASARARLVQGDITLGISGEHGADPASIAFFEEKKMDYISCSPLRIPIARLAAAQATLKRLGA